MFKGSRQGGGGSAFVTLTGLFNTKKGTGMIGSIKPDAFSALIQMMEECDEKGVDLVFFVGENNRENSKAAAYLSVTVGKPREEREQPKNTAWSRRTPTTSGSTTARSTERSGPRAAFGDGLKSGGKNPPKDPLESYLEDDDNIAN